MQDQYLIRIHASADNYWQRACNLWPKLRSMAQPMTLINNRLKTAAGRSHSAQNWIDFNAKLIPDNIVAYEKEIIPHELAHNIADRLFNSSGHDKAWASVYKTLTGREATVKHSLDTSKAFKTYKYACACKTWQFSPQRHALAQSTIGMYICRTCNTTVKQKLD